MLGSALILTLTSLHITGCFAGPRDGEARKAHLLWTTDLRNVGYSANEPSRLGSVDAHLQLAFGSASELVVLNDQGPFGKPNEARAFVLSVVSGEVVNQKKWMTETWPFVFATAKGGYVAVTDQGMDLYSSGLKQVVASSPESARLASPDGAIVAAWSSELKPGHGLTLFLDTKTLKPTGTEVLDKNVESVSRSHAAYVGYWAKSRNAIVFFVPEDDKLRPYNTSCQEIRPKFISEGMFVLFGCGELEVVSAAGVRLFGAHINGESGIAAVSTIEIKDLRGRNNGSSAAALSPDGSLLAINSLGTVRLFDLPATS